MPSKALVLAVPNADSDGLPILLHVLPSKAGSLDLTLTATEGANPYTTKIKATAITRLKAKAFHGTNDEWEVVLRNKLLQEPVPADVSPSLLKSVEMVAVVQDAEYVMVTIRKQVGEITQKLGSIQLPHEENVEIELFDWATVAAQAALANKNLLSADSSKTDELQATIDKLTKELEKEKSEVRAREDELLGKFAKLLNAKKAKIRELQRQQPAPASPEEEEEPVRELPTRKNKKPTPSTGKGKRKAQEEAMQVDVEVSSDDPSSDDEQSTTASETDDENVVGSLPPPRSRNISPPLSRKNSQSQSQSQSAAPPKRSLPFDAKGDKEMADAEDGSGSETD